MVRIAVQVDEATRDRLIELAGGERKLGEKLDELVAAEYARQTVTLERLAAQVQALTETIRAWQKFAQRNDWFRGKEGVTPVDDDTWLFLYEKQDRESTPLPVCLLCGGYLELDQEKYDHTDILICDGCGAEY